MQRVQMLQLDSEVLSELSRARFGSLEALAKRAGVDRSTLYRWAKGKKLPSEREGLLAVARALAVDPLLLWRLDASVYDQGHGWLETLIRGKSFGALVRGLAYLDGLLLPAGDWPAAEIARSLGLRWESFEFSHDPAAGANYYAPIRLSSSQCWQVWYFAYRNVSGLNRTWQPYGLVMRHPVRLLLLSVTAFEDVTIEAAANDFVVETWFGPGSADFRIASLHEFKGERGTSTCSSAVVRFALP